MLNRSLFIVDDMLLYAGMMAAATGLAANLAVSWR